jgi:subtilase family serine protease
MKSRDWIILWVELLETRATPAVMTPAMVRHAYGFDQIAFSAGAGTIAGDGRGTTIAIVNAYNDPFVASDLDTFDRQFRINGSQSLYQQYGSASSFLTVAKPQGNPANSPGWAGEIALDVEWAHAIAPGAKILLVEARSSSLNDLLSAVNYARNQPGVVAVSMSWGASEFSSETSATLQSYFTTPAGHAGVTFVGASGDFGAPATWPAVSTNVLSVGGTRLNVDGAGNYLSESGWSGSGGGPSRYFGKPSFQTAYAGSRRGSPDVAYDADPNSGFIVYNTYDGGWEQIGGTSAGAPQWAAIVALANELRGRQGRLPLGLATPQLYAIGADRKSYREDFHDITLGNNALFGDPTQLPGFPAGPGYDLPTGLGTPVVSKLLTDLAGRENRGLLDGLAGSAHRNPGHSGDVQFKPGG